MSNDAANPPNSGTVLTIAQIIKNVMSSAAEAELGALFINYREAVPARHTLEEMGHNQPPTPMQTDNATALGVVTNKIASKTARVAMPRHPRAIPPLLVSWPKQRCRLLNKTPHTNPSSCS